MIDAWLEPDDCYVLEYDDQDEDQDIDIEEKDEWIIALHNYECMVYDEPELRIAR